MQDEKKERRKWSKRLRVRLFWVKMISGNHFHPFPHVWLSRKISFFGKWLPIDQFFHLWPGNQFLPSFSLQMTFGKREREREKRKPRSEREREKEERATIALARSTIDNRRSTRSRGAIVDLPARSSITRRDRRARSSDAHRSSALVGRARSSDAYRSSARSKNRLHFFCWVLVFLPDLMHFL